ncbi:MAG: hypothetical protein GC171_09620 [Terrimonas sp.]|nr:hypothetical protein [Terrimonas sp.]
MQNDQNAISPQRSLELIQSMIDKAKDSLSHNRFYFLLWGWITFTAIIGQFLLKVVWQYPHHYYVWFLTFVGAGISIYYSSKQNRKRKVKTYVEESMSILWLGMGISFFVMCMLFVKMGWENCYPFFILMYGLGTFVSGRMLNFTPLVIGGMTNWALAITAIWFPFDFQMIFAAAAILFSYIIPGHLLKDASIKE